MREATLKDRKAALPPLRNGSLRTNRAREAGTRSTGLHPLFKRGKTDLCAALPLRRREVQAKRRRTLAHNLLGFLATISRFAIIVETEHGLVATSCLIDGTVASSARGFWGAGGLVGHVFRKRY
jgi:hypothetical protein